MLDLVIYSDYPLDGYLNHFEAYMFATTEKHYTKHYDFGEMLIIDEDSYEYLSMKDLKIRKKSLTKFNQTLKSKLKISDLKSNNVKIAMIDITDETNLFDENECNQLWKKLSSCFIEFCKKTNHVGVMVQHFYQNGRPPHIHYMIDKVKYSKNYDEFQNYLINGMEN